MKRIIFSVLILFLSGAAQSETVYVTDMLQLDMYATSAMTGSSIRKLRSGEKMEILERTGRTAHVRVEGIEGWVKSLYLVGKEPARTRVNQLERSNKSLESTVKKLRSQLAAEQGKVTELTASQGGEAAQLASSQAELEKTRQENKRLEQRLSSYAGSVPLNWLLIAVVIALVGGAYSGWYYIDKRSRSKHGGYRVY